MKNICSLMRTTLGGIALGLICWSGGDICQAQTAQANPSGLSPDLQEVVALARQHMGDDIIENYVKSTGKAYKLSADDIIYLNSQGVSQAVISTLLQTASAGTAPAGNSGTPSTSSTPAPTTTAVPPPVTDNSPAPESPANSAPNPESGPSSAPPLAAAPLALLDNFYNDAGLNLSLWQNQSGLLSTLAAMNGSQVLPALVFSPGGMQMSGINGPGQFMGIQSVASYSPPFTFNATVTGQAPNAIPFEIYLVSGDLQQWVSIAGHLGGWRREGGISVGGGFGFFRGGVNVPLTSETPNYGVWLNHTASGLPISSLGYRFYGRPLAGVPYTIEISAGADGAAAVSLQDSAGNMLASQNVPVGTGPFYVVLAGRNGPTFANWQSVQLLPSGPPVAPVVETPVAPTVPTLDYFQAQLAPYGNWVTLPGYGLCWQPAVSTGWRPYYDGGHWEYTDAGWYWQSDYPWGDIAFHYGRWTFTDAGWVWIPGYDYAPAWVVWRHADDDGYLGWAPLPPGAVFADGGWDYNGARVGADFDFGLSVGFFTFVGYDHFWEHDFRHFVVPHDRVEFVFRRSRIESHYRLDHGRFINEGLGRDRMVVLTHHDFHAVPMHQVRVQEERRNVQIRRDDIHSFKDTGRKVEATRPVGAYHAPEHGGAPLGHPEQNHGMPLPEHGGSPAGHPEENHGVSPEKNSNNLGGQHNSEPGNFGRDNNGGQHESGQPGFNPAPNPSTPNNAPKNGAGNKGQSGGNNKGNNPNQKNNGH